LHMFLQKGHPDSLTAAAVGGLLNHLYNEQKVVRKEFSAVFSKFNSKTNTKIYERLFG